MACGCSGGGARANTYLSFVVVNDSGVEVEEWPSFHEARVRAGALGTGMKVETRRRSVDTPQG